jgi:glyoxylase-like metal-dependent hydrolase (beta-lactamase superfamily II)
MIDRRAFLADLGKGAFAVALVGLAGCSPSVLASLAPTASPAGAGGPTPPPSDGSGSPGGGTAGPSEGPPRTPAPGRSWARVNLGFVSAYLLVHDGEVAVVDTGVAGSADQIERVLTNLGLAWSGVGNVILTHWHNDHAGSIGEVMRRAAGATGWAGEPDIPRIGGSPRPLQVAAEGDTIFDLQVIETPGHTSGSISLLDASTGLLVAGDALRTTDGAPALPQGQFTLNEEEAKRSVVKLGKLDFETLLVGHGDPIEVGAAAMVEALGAAG